MTSAITSHMQWQLQEAKARFSEVVDASLRQGPQLITRRGQETAVLVSVEEWRRLKQAARAGLKEMLLDGDNRFELALPERGHLRSRTAG